MPYIRNTHACIIPIIPRLHKTEITRKKIKIDNSYFQSVKSLSALCPQKLIAKSTKPFAFIFLSRQKSPVHKKILFSWCVSVRSFFKSFVLRHNVRNQNICTKFKLWLRCAFASIYSYTAEIEHAYICIINCAV